MIHGRVGAGTWPSIGFGYTTQMSILAVGIGARTLVESQTQCDLFSILSQLRYPGWSGRLALVGGQPFSFAFGLAYGFSASFCHG